MDAIRSVITNPWVITGWLILDVISLGLLLYDLKHDNPEIMSIMKFVWVLTVLYSGPLGLCLFEASLFLDLRRLPELFCGFTRHPGEGPTLYPVACAPQAWASASIFLLLQACLGLSFQHPTPQIRALLRDLQIGWVCWRGGTEDHLTMEGEGLGSGGGTGNRFQTGLCIVR